MSEEKDWRTQFVEWCEKTIPGLLAALGIGYRLGAQDKAKTVTALKKTELQLKLKENELANEKKFGGRTSDDVLDEFFGDGVGPKKPASEDKG